MTIVPHTYGALLWGAMTVNLFMVMASTVTGAFLVEAGQSLGATGRLTALRVILTCSQKRFNCTKRARVTRSRIAADGSSDTVPVRSLSSIAGTST